MQSDAGINLVRSKTLFMIAIHATVVYLACVLCVPNPIFYRPDVPQLSK